MDAISLCCLGVAHSSDACVLLCDVVVDFFVIESREGGSDVVLLAHFEVFAEVLVSTPPISINHAKSLVTSDLMDV